MKFNETKTVHVNFTNKIKDNYQPVRKNNYLIPYASAAQYLALHLDLTLG